MFESANRRGDGLGKRNLIVDAAKDLVENCFAGVTKGRMTEVMAQCCGFREVLVEAERAGNGACQLTDFKGVGEPGARMISNMRDEDLGLVLEATEGA
jgi:hypothetical protein